MVEIKADLTYSKPVKYALHTSSILPACCTHLVLRYLTFALTVARQAYVCMRIGKGYGVEFL